MTRPAVKFDFSGMLVNQAAGNGQPQPGTAFAAADHRIKERVLQMRGNARPVIFHINSRGEPVAGAVQRKLKRSAGAQNNFAARRAQCL